MAEVELEVPDTSSSASASPWGADFVPPPPPGMQPEQIPLLLARLMPTPQSKRWIPASYSIRRRYGGTDELFENMKFRESGYLAVALGDIVTIHASINYSVSSDCSSSQQTVGLLLWAVVHAPSRDILTF
jgi:hypothetical protein